jgi:hypothetical protein
MPRIETFAYKPTEKQLRFHRCTADEALYGGAAGGGKSTAAVADAFIKCMATPGVSAYLFRRTYPELEDTLIATARRLIPASLGKYSATAHEYRLVNGSVMRFRHVQNDGDVYAYQGAEMQYLYIDELTHFPKQVTVDDILKKMSMDEYESNLKIMENDLVTMKSSMKTDNGKDAYEKAESDYTRLVLLLSLRNKIDNLTSDDQRVLFNELTTASAFRDDYIDK